MGLSLEALNHASPWPTSCACSTASTALALDCRTRPARRPASGFMSQSPVGRALVEVVRGRSEAEALGVEARAGAVAGPIPDAGEALDRPQQRAGNDSGPQIALARRVGPGGRSGVAPLVRGYPGRRAHPRPFRGPTRADFCRPRSSLIRAHPELASKTPWPARSRPSPRASSSAPGSPPARLKSLRSSSN